MNALQIIEEQEEAAAAMMRGFGLRYTTAMIAVLDAQNSPVDGDDDEEGEEAGGARAGAPGREGDARSLRQGGGK